MSKVGKKRPSITVLGTAGYVQEPARFDRPALLQAMGANTGNLIFQHAVSLLFDANYRYVGRSGMAYSDPNVVVGSKFLIFPAANHLRPGTDWEHLSGFLERVKNPLVVLGLGAQSSIIGGAKDTIATLKADKSVTRLADVLREKASFVSVRGAYSQTVCHELGLRDVTMLGCPSAMINPAETLGQDMALALKAHAESTAPKRFGFTAAAPYEVSEDKIKLAFERVAMKWLRHSDGLYIQQSGGDAVFEMCSGAAGKISVDQWTDLLNIIAPEWTMDEFQGFFDKNARQFHSALTWMNEIQNLDLMLGTRIHGNMAGLGAGIPGVLVAHDSRTGELAQAMHIPTIEMKHAIKAQTLHEALGDVQFDPMVFDQWRQETARTYVEAFTKIDLPPSRHLLKLAGLSMKKKAAS